MAPKPPKQLPYGGKRRCGRAGLHGAHGWNDGRKRYHCTGI